MSKTRKRHYHHLLPNIGTLFWSIGCFGQSGENTPELLRNMYSLAVQLRRNHEHQITTPQAHSRASPLTSPTFASAVASTLAPSGLSSRHSRLSPTRTLVLHNTNPVITPPTTAAATAAKTLYHTSAVPHSTDVHSCCPPASVQCGRRSPVTPSQPDIRPGGNATARAVGHYLCFVRSECTLISSDLSRVELLHVPEDVFLRQRFCVELIYCKRRWLEAGYTGEREGMKISKVRQ